MAGAGLSRSAKKSAELRRILHREAELAQTKKINEILKLPASERSEEQNSFLKGAPEVVHVLQGRARNREKQKQRCMEKEDSSEQLQSKCTQLANAIRQSSYTVIYTGAGISTAASIPDYRGPNGVWTLLQKGETPKAVDLSDAEPTYTHMCITKLHDEGLIKHVVSQNCDGLHMRSGLPRSAISELHGNMYLELCKACQPVVERIRLFDVTERTGLRRHKTGRTCSQCKGELQDSIIHFGEKGPLHSPYNWKQAAKAADQAELVICLGTSLKVLRRYPCLWSMHKPPHERPKLIVVNLMWTPKDDLATLKINGKCDEALKQVMTCLNLTPKPYTKVLDPIFTYAVPLTKRELSTHRTKLLNEPSGYNKATICTMLSDVIAKRPPVEVTESDAEGNPGVSDNEVIESDDIEQPVATTKTIKKVEIPPAPVQTTRRHNTRKRKLSAKVLQAMDDLNGANDFLDDAPVNGKAGKAVPNKQRKTAAVANVLTKTGKVAKRRGRPARRGRTKKATRKVNVQQSLDNGVEDMEEEKLDEQKEFDKEFLSKMEVESKCQTEEDCSEKSSVVSSLKGEKTEEISKKSPSRLRVALPNGQHCSTNQNAQPHQNEESPDVNSSEQCLVKSDKCQLEVDSKSYEDVSAQETKTGDNDIGENSMSSTGITENLNEKTGELTQTSEDGHSIVIKPIRPESLSVVTTTTLPVSTVTKNAASPIKTPELSTPSPVNPLSPSSQLSPGPLSPPVAGSKKKTLNNLLEKIQARRTESSTDAQSHSYTHLKLNESTTVSKSPKKIKDYLAQSESRSSQNADPAHNQQPKASPLSDNASSSTSGRIICVNGCEGYEPGEVHSHSPNHVPALDNSVLGIPHLDIQQVWAATYSACFMASYQALQNKVLQSPHTTTQFTQPDLLNLTTDVTFQAQLLAQFQQNLLRSMAGVVSPEKQAHVLAQTQQVLMQNIAAMQKTQTTQQQPQQQSPATPVVQPPNVAAPVTAGAATVTSSVPEAPANHVIVSSGSAVLPLSQPQVAWASVAVADPLSLASPASSSSGSDMAAGTSAKSFNVLSPSISPIPGAATSPRLPNPGTSGVVLNGNQFLIQSPSTSPAPSASTSPRLVNKVARGVCGPRNKHKKKWWEVEPSDEVSSIVNHHLSNIRKAAQERTVVRQELERRTQSLPNEIARHTPQRCKRRSMDELLSAAFGTQASTSEEDVTSSAQLQLSKQQQREAALRALIAAQHQPSPPQQQHNSVSSPQLVDLNQLTSAEQALVGLTSNETSVVTIEPEAPEETGPLALDCSQSVTEADGDGNKEPVSAPPAIIPGWFGKGWRANKRVGRRKKSR